MTTETQQTVKQWLEGLANTNTSSKRDSRKMQHLLHRNGYHGAVVTVAGIVYMEGRETLEAPPTSIHSIAKMLLEDAA